MDEPWVAIQRNRKSGSGKRNREVLRLIEYLRQQGVKTPGATAGLPSNAMVREISSSDRSEIHPGFMDS